MAIEAFVLMETTGNHTKSAYKTLTRITGVKAVYPVTGPFDLIAQVEAEGLSGDEALMTAFEMNKNDKTRVSGN